jgi:peptide methionine sulfoxide reductase msrA/msrB
MQNIKKYTFILTSSFLLLNFISCAQDQNLNTSIKEQTSNKQVMSDSSTWNILNEEETRVIVNKGTEYAFKGEFVDNHAEGIYSCKRCDSQLFKSDSKFDSGSGWPAFDDMIGDSVEEIPDIDGHRTEIVCNNCKAHLGHVFKNEGFTKKNTRHCVNSISLKFTDQDAIEVNTKLDTAIFASGCFWGTEYYFEKENGVISTQVGYIGGYVNNPTYKQVCTGNTGHAEAVQVIFDPNLTSYETLCKLFFETHDPSQINRQGPDIGTQYRTELFYLNNNQLETAERLKSILENKGEIVSTKITEATTFWKAEAYHEHYYSTKGGTPYCHGYTKRFDD